jgi:hypothetical protein
MKKSKVTMTKKEIREAIDEMKLLASGIIEEDMALLLKLAKH